MREIPVSLVRMDYWFVVTADGKQWIDILEFKARYEAGMQGHVFDYSCARTC